MERLEVYVTQRTTIMEQRISPRTLQNAELILRLTMAITLLITGISKFFSKGAFHALFKTVLE